MVSAQIVGTLSFYRKTPNGSLVSLFSATTPFIGPSGSSNGTIASTPEKWSYIPALTSPNKVLQAGDHVVVTFKPQAAATTDASDCEFAIAITLADGTTSVLGSPDDATEWDVQQFADIALLASREIVVCEKTVRSKFALGSNTAKSFASIEDNA